ncbi:unnamed protein product [Phytomonas sp. EM1]|nr:unnamed protein product [Phytomonas sp. EM1]|eukprot:CCW65151.1 unnamed protein product [Phytomonas sp. isolate EM1]
MSLTARELQRLEEAAWREDASRRLYATPHLPGFPWHTVIGADGLARRHVVPYDFTFRVFVKGRWVGRRLLEVYAGELPHHAPAYYAAGLASGRLRCVARRGNLPRRQLKRGRGGGGPLRDPSEAVSAGDPIFPSAADGVSRADGGLPPGGDVVLRHGDVVLHTVHRHEVPVAMGGGGVAAVELLAVHLREEGGLIGVGKPTGLPTHPTGRYAYNAVVEMLAYVLAPKRLKAWLTEADPLLQSLVRTHHLTASAKEALWAYYRPAPSHPGDFDPPNRDGEEVAIEKLPRPCHRLDRVTSGILLLGVGEATTSRVSRALMRKSKHVEAVVLAAREASEGALPFTRETHEGGDSLRHVLAEPLGVRKRYLARVSGRFPPRETPSQVGFEADPVSPGVFHVDEETMARVNRDLLPQAGKGEERNSELARAMSEVEPGGILFVNPVAASKAHAEGEASELISSSSSPAVSAPARRIPQTAMTLCQRLRFIPGVEIFTGEDGGRSSNLVNPDDGQAKGLASILQCIPFTGRLHQIRVHLSEWGFPIEGDTIYGAPPANSPLLTASEKQKHDSTAEEVAKPSSAPSSSYVYYDPSQLPRSYLEYMKQCRSSEGKGSEKNEKKSAVAGIHEPEEEKEEDVVEEEGLCYECAGKLPIIALDESVNASAIRLHAWRYELDEDVIFGSDYLSEGEDPDKDNGCAESALKIRKDEGSANYLPRRDADEAMEVIFGSNFVKRVGKQIVFSSPLPEWALE